MSVWQETLSPLREEVLSPHMANCVQTFLIAPSFESSSYSLREFSIWATEHPRDRFPHYSGTLPTELSSWQSPLSCQYLCLGVGILSKKPWITSKFTIQHRKLQQGDATKFGVEQSKIDWNFFYKVKMFCLLPERMVLVRSDVRL